MPVSERSLIGCILGTAVGDALGLPYEGLSPRRAARLFGPPTRYHMLPNRGMVSDDTEHTCMAAQAMIASGSDINAFSRQFARQLRLWFLVLPVGGGRATITAAAKLCLGIPPRYSGVFSAGNGPAMRSAILGAAIDDIPLLRQFVRASTRMTHTDSKAEHASFAVALAARMACDRNPIDAENYRRLLQVHLVDPSAAEFLGLLDRVFASLEQKETTRAFAASIGLSNGVSGYIYHTVPVVLHCWLRHPADFRTAIIEIIECGGDADSTAAILGGIIGCSVGKEGIPAEWIDHLWEWPRTVQWMEKLAIELAVHRIVGLTGKPLSLPLWGLLPRNLLLLAIAIAHVVRRVLPPY